MGGKLALALCVGVFAVSASSALAARPQCGFTVAFHEKTGLCRAGGATAYFAALPHTLRIQTLAAKLEGWHEAPGVSSQAGSAKASGVFLVLRMHITNESEGPGSYQDAQAELVVGPTTYAESRSAENGPDQGSLTSQDVASGGLPAGKAETGDMVFDVPSAAVAQFAKGEAVLVLGDYRTHLTSGALPNGVGLLYF